MLGALQAVSRIASVFKGKPPGRTPITAESGRGIMASVVNPGGDPPLRDTWQFLQAYNNMPWLRAVVSKIAYSSATVEWVLYAKKDTGGKYVKDLSLHRRKSLDLAKGLDQASAGSLKAIKEHPLLDLMNDPNPLFPGISTRMLGYIYMELTGERFYLIDRGKLSGRGGQGLPTALWPVPPHWVIGTPSVDRPNFRLSFRAWHLEVPQEDVLWHKVLDPLNPYARGAGMARAMADELDADEAAAQLMHAQFENRGRPETILSLPDCDDDQIKQIREDWVAESRGLSNFFRTHFLNQKMDLQQLTQTNENMQLVQLRQFSRDTIRQQVGVPPEVMGIIDQSNRATIDAADFIFTKHVLIPRLEQEREFLQKYLVCEYDDRLVIDYISPLESDKAFALSVMNAKPASFTIDEHRAVAGYPPLEGGKGKVYIVPGSLIAVKDPAELKKQDPAAAPGAPGAPGMPGMPGAGAVEDQPPPPEKPAKEKPAKEDAGAAAEPKESKTDGPEPPEDGEKPKPAPAPKPKAKPVKQKSLFDGVEDD